MNVLFRTDADAAIGLGHLQRCLSLAMALRQQGARCLFLSRPEPGVAERVQAAGFETAALDALRAGSAEDAGCTLALARKAECAAVVVDSYAADEWYWRRLREGRTVLVAIDDLAKVSSSCDVMVNGGVHADGLAYRTNGGTMFLLGPSYALLRPEFKRLQSRRVRRSARRVLVTVGGADPRGLMPRLLERLGCMDAEVEVLAILGPLFEDLTALKRAAAHSRRPLRLVRNPPTVSDLMRESDVAVAAGGQTLYELAATGTPTLAIPLADNQRLQAQRFSELGTVLTLEAEEAISEVLRRRVERLLCDAQARARMSQAGQRLIDGEGATRVAEALLERMRAGRAKSVRSMLSLAER